MGEVYNANINIKLVRKATELGSAKKVLIFADELLPEDVTNINQMKSNGAQIVFPEWSASLASKITDSVLLPTSADKRNNFWKQ